MSKSFWAHSRSPLPVLRCRYHGYQVASAIGVVYVHTPIKFVPLFTEDFFLKVVVAGIFFGLVTVLVIETLRATRRFLEKHARRLVIRALAGGGLIVLLVELTSEKYLGLGVAQMALYTSGQPAEWFIFCSNWCLPP